ncbi:MAG: bifunctional oligoribonuclease/PAP phosphatase NrnA [Flavobacteriales bacterium]|nr:MAG: bifunctional oligoribonuclease/PAP phosphatase NrnA [Flavobacteriales bacterium]
MEEALGGLRSLLGTPKRTVIVTHYNPDGDAIGSSLGWMHLLRAAGHPATVVLPNQPPAFLRWMPGYDEAVAFDVAPAKAEQAVRDADVLFCLDFNRLDRVEKLEQTLRKAPLKVLIDHHREPEAFDIAFSDITACATAQMVHDIAVGLGWRGHIDQRVATCLYTGIMTDSGSFRFSSTTPHTLRVGADLMERGAVPDTIQSAIFDDNSFDRLRLTGFALSERLQLHADLGVAVIALSRNDLERFSFQPGDTEGLVNYGLSIKGTKLAAFFMERPDRVKVSLRSKAQYPADRICAEHFLGGGHRNAAGGHAFEPLADVVERFLKVVPAYL